MRTPAPISVRRSAVRGAAGHRLETTEHALAEERARTGAWLHDHTLQLLEYIAAGAYDDDVTVDRLREIAVLAGDELRDYIEDRKTAPVVDLATALRREIAAVQIVAGALTIELDCEGDAGGLSSDQVVALAAAAREALTNVRKHACATRVLVTCTVTSSGAEVTVADDGVGFDPHRVAPGLGLHRSVVGRMLGCGGSARVVSHPGHGTLVVLTAGSTPPRALPGELSA